MALAVKSQTIDISHSLIRLCKPDYSLNVKYVDLDMDGDPDLIQTNLFDSIPIYWIDDDDDMKIGDLEGDLDNDCLIIDRNVDGIFAGPGDLSLDWVDSNNDGTADMQVVIDNSKEHFTKYWDWGWNWDWESNYMWIIDTEKDETFHYIDWKKLVLKCWSHSGTSNFYEDYQGQTLFQKAHIPSYRFGDLRYSWENPFLFYDTDQDGLTEIAIRLVDSCSFKDEKIKDSTTVYVQPAGKINEVQMSFDLDNDNRPSNEFDFDMSLYFFGDGFSYSNQVHHFKNMKGLPAADSLFFDNRWRQMDELIYTDHDSAWTFIFDKGKWKQCWFVFDEDDDCGRWERVELYQPKDPFIIGMNKGGIDNNGQADASGDRGEWDLDNSGNGNMYIGFDGKMHLYGAEKGYWRIDQDASSYQGWGGLYEETYERTQNVPQKFPTIAYEDTNNDGFFNLIKFDLDGDTLFEESFNLIDYNIKCQYKIYKTSQIGNEGVNELFQSSANKNWEKALAAIETAKKFNINYKWYNRFLYPGSLNEKYKYAWWIQFYLFTDFLELAERINVDGLKEKIIQAYFTGNWELLALSVEK